MKSQQLAENERTHLLILEEKQKEITQLQSLLQEASERQRKLSILHTAQVTEGENTSNSRHALELEGLHADIERLEKLLSESNENKMKLISENDCKSKRIEELEKLEKTETEKLKTTVINNEQQLKSLEESHHIHEVKHKEEILALKNNENELNSRLSTSALELQEKNREIESLKMQIHHLTTHVQGVETKHDSDSAQDVKYSEDMLALKKRISFICHAREESKANVQSKEMELQEKNKEIESLKIQIHHLTEQLTEINKQNKKDEEVNFKVRLAHEHLDTFDEQKQLKYKQEVAKKLGVAPSSVIITSLEAGSVIVGTKVIGLSPNEANRLKSMVDDNNTFSAIVEDFKPEDKVKESHVTTTMATNTSISNDEVKLIAAEAEIVRLKSELDLSIQERENLTNKALSLQQQNDHQKAHIISLEEEISKLKTKIAESEQLIFTLKNTSNVMTKEEQNTENKGKDNEEVIKLNEVVTHQGEQVQNLTEKLGSIQQQFLSNEIALSSRISSLEQQLTLALQKFSEEKKQQQREEIIHPITHEKETVATNTVENETALDIGELMSRLSAAEEDAKAARKALEECKINQNNGIETSPDVLLAKINKLEKANEDLCVALKAAEQRRQINGSPRLNGPFSPRTDERIPKIQAAARGYLTRKHMSQRINALSAGVLVAMRNTRQGTVFSLIHV